jgi:SAM-dependent methyltransferase
VFVTAMIPAPGESPGEWWERTAFRRAVEEQAARDGGLTGSDDPYVAYYHDVPRELAARALAMERAHPSSRASSSPWPLDALPDVPTRFVLCTKDRFFPAAFMRRVVTDRLGIAPSEIDAGHCVALARPAELASLLEDAGRRPRPRLRLVDHYDAELRHHHERLLAAADVRPGERVLDVGCGGGQSTRAAARLAAPGHVLGVDISDEQLERARRRTAEEPVENVAYQRGDAEVLSFPPASFDVIISRFGTMFFADPQAAFRNLARAARPGGRLAMIVWQRRMDNEWATAIHDALGAATPPSRLDAFSLADPAAVRALLDGAGFADAAFTEVRAPVYYGPDAAAALELVWDMKTVRDRLAQADSRTAQRAVGRLREVLAAHQTDAGVLFDSRAWIVTARCARSDTAEPRTVIT